MTVWIDIYEFDMQMNTQRHHTENNDPKVVVNRAQHKQRGRLVSFYIIIKFL